MIFQRSAWPLVLAAFTLLGSMAMAETEKTKTHCIGRLLVEVPEEFEVLRHDGTVRETRIERIGPGTERDAERLYEERVRALRDGEVTIDTVKMLYRDVGRIGALRTVSMLIDWTDGGFQPQEPWREETYVSSEGTIFHLETSMDNGNADAARSDIQAVADAIHPRTAGDMPAGEGTCLENSFFALAPGNEQIGATFVHATERAILLRVSTSVRDPGNGTLDFSAIQGTDGEPVRIAGLEGKELRLWDGPINLSAIVGQQPGLDRPGYKVTLEYSDSRKDAASPPYTREEARSSWESFTGSIQVKK
ncbi:hypothetical protein K3725_17580 [Leisingera sp. S132]|uniref:hypothetical protein n=1 Tax=Leisingera sp. S132 TaxID=2867016 RepID=UPI0021A7DB94|nr:hypothetical protein [Leisingera sp. S132]UWQ79084.1 hypothetical protein K3725_17580 [Leisingera sp. S132]